MSRRVAQFSTSIASSHYDKIGRLPAMIASRFEEGSLNGARTARPKRRTRSHHSLVKGFYKTPINAQSTGRTLNAQDYNNNNNNVSSAHHCHNKKNLQKVRKDDREQL